MVSGVPLPPDRRRAQVWFSGLPRAPEQVTKPYSPPVTFMTPLWFPGGSSHFDVGVCSYGPDTVDLSNGPSPTAELPGAPSWQRLQSPFIAPQVSAARQTGHRGRY